LVSDRFCHRWRSWLWPCLLTQHLVQPYLEPRWSAHTWDFPESTKQTHNKKRAFTFGSLLWKGGEHVTWAVSPSPPSQAGISHGS
jgi:hypothetical protein